MVGYNPELTLGCLTQMLEVGLLMGLMCQYSCEECEFITFQENNWQAATVEPGTILNALERLLQQQENIKMQVGVKICRHCLKGVILNKSRTYAYMKLS